MKSRITRRDLIAAASASAASALLPGSAHAAESTGPGSLTFGFITDVHHGTHDRDGVGRVEPFVAEATRRQVSFILECGDFNCHKGGAAAGKTLMDVFNRFPGPRHHVLGNHDHDYMTKEQAVELYGMPAPHYSFDAGDFHFIVLDRNFVRRPDGTIFAYSLRNWNYVFAKGEFYMTPPGTMHSCIDEVQMKWLEQDLAATRKLTVVFLHQPVVVGTTEGNWIEVAHRIDRHNARVGHTQVIAVFSGHDHDELHTQRHGTHYLTLSSAAYALPLNAGGARYYAKPLYTFVTLDPAGGIHIEGADSTYAPEARATPEMLWLSPPKIQQRRLQFQPA